MSLIPGAEPQEPIEIKPETLDYYEELDHFFDQVETTELATYRKQAVQALLESGFAELPAEEQYRHIGEIRGEYQDRARELATDELSAIPEDSPQEEKQLLLELWDTRQMLASALIMRDLGYTREFTSELVEIYQKTWHALNSGIVDDEIEYAHHLAIEILSSSLEHFSLEHNLPISSEEFTQLSYLKAHDRVAEELAKINPGADPETTLDEAGFPSAWE